MGKKEVGIVLSLEGEKEYTQGFSNAVKSTKQLQEETKSLAEEFKGSANSMQALQAKQENLTRAQEAFKQKLEAANTGLSNARKELDKQTEAHEKLKEKVEAARKALEKMKENGEEGSDSYKQQEKAVEELNTALQKQTQNMMTAQGRVTDWNTKVIRSEADVRKSSKALEENSKYLDEASHSANGCATSINEYGEAAKKTSNNLEDLGEATEETTKTSTNLKDKLETAIATKGISLAADAIGKLKDEAIEAAKYVVEVGSSFEAAMSEVQAISGASGEDLTSMSEKAKELGSSTKFSATEVAEGFKYMSLAGWSTSDMLSGIDGVLNLAAASGMDLANASDMVTDYLSAFGLQASDSAHMADMLAYAQANSNTSAKQLGEAYGNCAAILHSGGQDIETVTSLLEGMANQGLKGSEAGTALSSIMTQITQKMKDGKIAIGDTSVEVADSNGNFRDLTDIVTDVDAALEGMGTQERSAALSATFNKTALSGLNLILNEGIGKISNYETALRSSNGAAEEMSGIMNDNLKGDLAAADSALEGLGIAAYNYIDGPVRSVVQGVTGIIQGITDTIEPQRTELGAFVDEVKSANETVEELLSKSGQTLDTAEIDTGTLEAYKEKLTELNDVENKNEWQKRQVKTIVEELSGTIPELAEAFDEESGSLRLTNTEINNLIENQEKLVMQQAIFDAQKESLEAVAEATIAKAKADAAVQAIEEEGGETLKAYIAQVESGCVVTGEAAEKYNALNGELKTAQEEQSKANDQLEQAKTDQETLQGTLSSLAEEYGITTESADETAEAVTNTTNAIQETGEAATEAATQLDEYWNDITGMSEEEAAAVTEATRQIMEAYEDMKDSIGESIENSISFFDEFSGGTEVTSEQIKANLDSQIEGIQNWSENMQTLAGEVGDGMSQEMYDALAEMGPESANLVQTLVDALNNGTGDFEEIASKWSEAMQLKDESDTIASYTTAGQDMANQLATSITNGTEVVTDAVSQVMESVKEAIGESAEGLGDSIVLNPDAILQKLDTYRDAGKELGESVAEGMQSSAGDIDKALSPDAGGLSGKTGEYEAAGKSLGDAFASGLGSSSDSAGQSGTQMAQSGAQAAQNQSNAMQTAGQQNAQSFTNALNAGKAQATTSGSGLGSAAKGGASSKSGEFHSVGSNMASGMASGINAGRSSVISAAASTAAAALAAAKARLDIHSPSKKFRSEVGHQIPTGMAFGIKDKESLASKAADAMSAAVYKKASVWLSAYKSKQKVAVEDEKWYWAQVTKHVKKGTTAYNDAVARMIVSGVSRTKTTGSGKKKKSVAKDTETYYSEIYSAAEKYMSNMETLNDVSTKDQLKYWQSIKKQLKSGTTAWYNAQSKIKSIQSKIGTVSNMTSILSAYKTYYNMSEKAEMQYWDTIRRQYKQGTEERLEADEKYLDAREKYYDKLADLDEDYQDKKEEINKKLKEDEAELTDKYNSELKERTKAIKDAYGLFDEFKSESADGKTLLVNIKGQVAGYEDWMQQMEELSGKGILDQGLIDELTEQGPEISAAIHALNSLTEDELKEYNEAYLQKLELSQKQAEKDTADLKKETEEQTKELKAQAEKSLEDLKKANDEAVAKVNTGISSSMKSLANQVKTIADDQTAQLVNAITGEKRKEGAEKTAEPKAAATTSSAKKTSSSTSASSTVKKTDKVLEAINSGKSRKKLTSSERKNHAALYNYIADHYGKAGDNNMYTKLASALGIKVSKTVTAKQKNTILSALKKKGYRQGGRVQDELTWMDEDLETKGPEMIVRKSDNAILTRTKPGDEILDASTAKNLAQIGKYSLEDLQALVREQGAAGYLKNLRVPEGISKVNQLMESGIARENNRQDMQKVELLLNQMNGLLSECMPYFQKIGQGNQISLDGDALVSGTAERMGTALAMRQRRRR